MVEKHSQPEKSDDQHVQGEASKAHAKLLGEASLGKPKPPEKADSKISTIEWPGGGKRAIHRENDGQVAKVLENDGTRYERETPGVNIFNHMKGDTVISSGSISVNEKTKEVQYTNTDNWTITTLKSDGSSLVQKHIAGQANDKCPVLEIHNPPKADGTTGDIRKFTYDNDGHLTGYQVVSSNKNLCSSWKTNDGVHWRKVDEKGNFIKDADKVKDEKNVLVGRMYISPDGVFAFDNQRKAPDETPHWTVVSKDGHRHERITNLDKPKLASAKPAETASIKETLKATDEVRDLQANVVKAHFDEIKPNNPVGWMGYIGKDDLDLVLKDSNRSAEQKLAAAILKKCMDIHGIGLIHSNELNGKVFQETLAKMTLDDIAYDQHKS
ncbi:MAG: hypothetical protein K2Y22_04635 [Candidatus Obscuribacterales bacterium]|nr:hypothetical protein [Candidatus Obscuribacterales bacterium]